MKLHRLVVAICIGLSVLLMLWAGNATAPNLVASWEQSTYDTRLQLRGPAAVGQYVVIVGRDEESDERFGRGIWDRSLFAQLMTGLGEAGAAVIAPDFFFDGPSPPVRGGKESDRVLIDASKDLGTVVYPLPIQIADSTLSQEVFDVRALLSGLVEHAKGIGHMGALSDHDGVYRRVPLLVDAGGYELPAFGLAISAAFLDVTPEQMVWTAGEELVLTKARYPGGETKTLSLPVDQQGQLLIDYSGVWLDAPFPYLSFVDVWDALEEKRIDELRSVVGGKIVLILHAAVGTDKRETPFELKSPGGFIHANLINTILTETWLKDLPVVWRGIIAGVVGIIAAAILLYATGWIGYVAVAGFGLLYLVIVQLVLTMAGVILPVIPAVMAIVLASGATVIWHNLTARREITRLEEAAQDIHRDLARSRDKVIQYESAIERLEEELDAAQSGMTSTTNKEREAVKYAEALRAQLQAAQANMGEARHEKKTLETQLADLRAAQHTPPALSERDVESLFQECAAMGILTRDAGVLVVFRDLKKISRTVTPLLLLGDAGTGKELFARAAHTLSPRAGRSFVPVNMAAIPAALFESELFGHVKGAFTGATSDRVGYFSQADKGTIFLDEVGDLPSNQQAKLLRVLQEGTFYRVGDTRPTTVNVRVVAATNKDLTQGVVEGWFREDLYYRLKGIVLRLPPLRERRGDIELLAESFIKAAAARAEREPLPLSQAARDLLIRHRWNGNVRELKQAIEQAVVLAEGDVVTAQDLRLEQVSPPQERSDDTRPISTQDVSGDNAVLSCLRRYGFDMQATAQALGWDRSTVTQRLKGMCFQVLVAHHGDRHSASVELAQEPALERVVELKVSAYYDHLLKVLKECSTADEAVAMCRRRLKNLPERYLTSVDALIRLHFDPDAPLVE